MIINYSDIITTSRQELMHVGRFTKAVVGRLAFTKADILGLGHLYPGIYTFMIIDNGRIKVNGVDLTDALRDRVPRKRRQDIIHELLMNRAAQRLRDISKKKRRRAVAKLQDHEDKLRDQAVKLRNQAINILDQAVGFRDQAKVGHTAIFHSGFMSGAVIGNNGEKIHSYEDNARRVVRFNNYGPSMTSFGSFQRKPLEFERTSGNIVDNSCKISSADSEFASKFKIYDETETSE